MGVVVALTVGAGAAAPPGDLLLLSGPKFEQQAAWEGAEAFQTRTLTRVRAGERYLNDLTVLAARQPATLRRKLAWPTTQGAAVVVEGAWSRPVRDGHFEIVLTSEAGDHRLTFEHQRDRQSLAWIGPADATPIAVFDRNIDGGNIEVGRVVALAIQQGEAINSVEVFLDGEHAFTVPGRMSGEVELALVCPGETNRLGLIRVAVEGATPRTITAMRYGNTYTDDEVPAISLRPVRTTRAQAAAVRVAVDRFNLSDPQATPLPVAASKTRQSLTPGQCLEVPIADAPLPAGYYRARISVAVGEAESSPPQQFEHRLVVLPAALTSLEPPAWFGIADSAPRWTADHVDANARLMRQLGFRTVRLALPLFAVWEWSDGLDWRMIDRLVHAHTEADLLPIVLLQGWDGSWEKRFPEALFTPDARQAWVDEYALPIMRRYPHIRDWELWNEVNAFWHATDPRLARGFARQIGTPANYMDLYTRLRSAVSHAATGQRVLTSLASSDLKQSLDTLLELGLDQTFDGLCVHTYMNHAGLLHQTVTTLREHGLEPKNLWVTEVSANAPAGDVVAQRAVLGKMLPILLSSVQFESLTGVTWFTLSDSFVNPYGLYDEAMQPKAYTLGFAMVGRLLSGAAGSEHGQTGEVLWHRITRRDLPPVLFLWSMLHDQRHRLAVADEVGEVTAWSLDGSRRVLPVRDGYVAVDVGQVPLAVTADARIDNPLSVVLRPATGQRLAVEVAASDEVRGPAQLRLTCEELQLHMRHDLHIEQQTSTVLLPVGDVAPEKSYAFDCRVEAGAHVRSARATVSFAEAVRVSAAQVEQVKAPDEARWLHLGSDFYEPAGDDDERRERGWSYAGESDLSARVAFGWTEQVLMIWVERRDDVLVPGQPGKFWATDGLQVAVNPTGVASPLAPFVELDAGVTADGRSLASVEGQPHISPAMTSLLERGVAWHRVTLNWSEIGVEPRPGMTIGVSLLLNEHDGHGREGWLAWGSGIATEKNPMLYRTVTLAD